MPIYIHHGGTGSFKTSGAIMDMVIPAIKKGRTVVTNIRGMSSERCYQAFPDAPDSFELIHIDTSTSEGVNKIARWFHWVPQGALLILDEATTCFPKAWRQSDIDGLDYPGGEDAANQDNRPPNWLKAWEMHRHYGWDIVLTTPNIKGIRDDIRGACDLAFKHRNRGHIGLKGSYIEAAHYADDNGSSPSKFIGVPLVKKIDKKVWELYDSTSTDDVKDVEASRPIWKDPKLRMGVVILALAFSFVLYNIAGGKVPFLTGNKDTQSSVTTLPQVAPMAPQASDSTNNNINNQRPNNVTTYPRTNNIVNPLQGLRIFVDGHMQIHDSGAPLVFFRIEREGYQPFIQDSNQIRRLGYTLAYITPCFVRLEFHESVIWATCADHQEEQAKENDDFNREFM